MRYVTICTAPYPGTDASGNPVMLPAGTVIDEIVWDGVTPYDPGPNLETRQSDTLQAGDVVTP